MYFYSGVDCVFLIEKYFNLNFRWKTGQNDTGLFILGLIIIFLICLLAQSIYYIIENKKYLIKNESVKGSGLLN
jgi:hypothetical protein